MQEAMARPLEATVHLLEAMVRPLEVMVRLPEAMVHPLEVMVHLWVDTEHHHIKPAVVIKFP